MDKLYLVEGQTGEYSDHREWPVAAYEDEEDAKAHVKQAEDWARSRKFLDETLPDGKAPDIAYADVQYDVENRNPFDINMQVDYTGVRYHHYAVTIYKSPEAYAMLNRLVEQDG